MIREYIKQLPEIVEAVDHEWKKYKNFKYYTYHVGSSPAKRFSWRHPKTTTCS